ncbi:MAG: septal ring lytic transglycosylase RlpA family protein, partial [Calditerrivibrio sp.]|nr:septal ring lytic transglycosylase RlpA family protein [Calditerrivibrio sp.]
MKYIIVFIIMLIYAVNINAKIIILDDQEEIPSKSESSNIDQTNGKNKIESMVYGKPYTVFGVTYYPLDYIHKYEEEGIASWYGADFHGKLTSSKEIYNMHDMTAAHKLLPLGSTVLVKSLENGKEIVVRINDRGPFVKDRIIDLSYKAAK